VVTLNDDTQPGTLIGRLRDRKHPTVSDNVAIPQDDESEEKAPYWAGYNNAISDAIDLFGEWMVDLLDEYPELEQDIQEHDRQRLNEYMEQLEAEKREADDEETGREIERIQSKIRSTQRKLDLLECIANERTPSEGDDDEDR
jgi:hypothetical protein